MLRDAGFVDIIVDVKEESAKYIKDWMPGSGAENYVASANITANKPVTTPGSVSKTVSEAATSKPKKSS